MDQKRCSKCSTLKSRLEFYGLKRSSDGLHSWCKDCCKKAVKDRRDSDPEKAKARQREKWAAYKAGLKLRTTPEAGSPEWDQRYRWSRRLAQARRQAARFGASVNDLTLDQWVEVVAEHDGRCFYCSVDGELWIDHMQALVVGGSNTRTNVVPACPDCNRRKSKKSVEFFLANKCARGHDLAGNEYVFPNGKKRVCKTCRLASFRRYRAKNRRAA